MSKTIRIGEFEFALNNSIDISIPLNFNSLQPNAYGVEPAVSNACEAGSLIGDTRRGGSCNFEQYTFIPHCNGTHTECVGHITDERISIRDCLRDVLIRAVLITIDPETANEEANTNNREDKLITRTALQSALASKLSAVGGGLSQSSNSPDVPIINLQPPAIAAGTDMALIIRTLPNDESKLTRQYAGVIPPYFTIEAMQFIFDSGFKHLLVDLPSIDRIYDEGKLSNHRIFWNIEPDSFETNADTRINSTITELVYVPNEVGDGEYLLNLQIAPFAADAAPSRPIIFAAL